MKMCPKCGGTIFYTTAHVVQVWLVDKNEDFIECTKECEEITHRPDDENVWQCSHCWYADSGSAFNVEESLPEGGDQMKITKAEATYTGGGIWVFYGELDDGNYFLCDDQGWVRILTEDPRIDFEESSFDEWQEERLVRDLEGGERKNFCQEIIDWLEGHPEDRGGMFESEMEAYRYYFNQN